MYNDNTVMRIDILTEYHLVLTPLDRVFFVFIL